MIIRPIDPAWKDWIQTLSWIGAVIGIVVALLKYISEQNKDREQRARELAQSKLELRWRQAEAAKKLLDEMLSDPYAVAAMRMLDWDDAEFEVKPDVKIVVSQKDYLTALRVSNLHFDVKEQYIRDCFDYFFYFMGTIEHYVQSELVRLEDVVFPPDYYMRIIDRNREVFEKFLDFYKLNRAARFMKRLDKYKQDALTNQPSPDTVTGP
jgi:hypothetical protein